MTITLHRPTTDIRIDVLADRIARISKAIATARVFDDSRKLNRLLRTRRFLVSECDRLSNSK